MRTDFNGAVQQSGRCEVSQKPLRTTRKGENTVGSNPTRSPNLTPCGSVNRARRAGTSEELVHTPIHTVSNLLQGNRKNHPEFSRVKSSTPAGALSGSNLPNGSGIALSEETVKNHYFPKRKSATPASGVTEAQAILAQSEEQSEEQSVCTRSVVGSTPTDGSNFAKGTAKSEVSLREEITETLCRERKHGSNFGTSSVCDVKQAPALAKPGNFYRYLLSITLSIIIILIPVWAGFGLPGWVAWIWTVTFFVGLRQSFIDYQQLIGNRYTVQHGSAGVTSLRGRSPIFPAAMPASHTMIHGSLTSEAPFSTSEGK